VTEALKGSKAPRAHEGKLELQAREERQGLEEKEELRG
jgi:hypothetical protein